MKKSDDTPRPISYSSFSTYVQCPHKWKLHYEDRIRPETEPYYFIFGRAVDVALNVLVLSLSKHKLRLAMNRALRELKQTSKNVAYDKRDFNIKFIEMDSATHRGLQRKLECPDWDLDAFDEMGKKLLKKAKLTKKEQEQLDTLILAVSFEKCKIIFKGFLEHIMPEILYVHSVQRRVKRGIIDFEATFKGHGRLTVDNKTSSWKYADDAIVWSVQFAAYRAKKAMYIVFDKYYKPKMKKPQVLVDVVPARNREIVEQAMQDVEAGIKARVFPRNLNNCDKQYGRPCIYRDLCWKNSMEGLVKLDEQKPKRTNGSVGKRVSRSRKAETGKGKE